MIIKLKNLYIYLIISIILSVEKKIYFFNKVYLDKFLIYLFKNFLITKKIEKLEETEDMIIQ